MGGRGKKRSRQKGTPAKKGKKRGRRLLAPRQAAPPSLSPYFFPASSSFYAGKKEEEKFSLVRPTLPPLPSFFLLPFPPCFAPLLMEVEGRRRKREGTFVIPPLPGAPHFPVRRFCLQQCFFFSLCPFFSPLLFSLRLRCRYKWPVGYITCLIQAEGRRGRRGEGGGWP